MFSLYFFAKLGIFLPTFEVVTICDHLFHNNSTSTNLHRLIPFYIIAFGEIFSFENAKSFLPRSFSEAPI